MAPKKSVPAKQHRSSSTSQADPPSSDDDPCRFISREAERLYHELLYNRSFIPEWGFPTSNAFFNFSIQNRGWQTLCAPPTPGVASIVREFHSNLRFRVDTTMFLSSRWVELGVWTINQIYQLRGDDSGSTRCYLWPPTSRA